MGKDKFFVMVCGSSNSPVPLCISADDIEVAALFDSEEEAEAAAFQNPFAVTRGYSVYPWEWA